MKPVKRPIELLVNSLFISLPIALSVCAFNRAIQNEQVRNIYIYLGIVFFLLFCYEIRQQLLHKKDFESSRGKAEPSADKSEK